MDLSMKRLDIYSQIRPRKKRCKTGCQTCRSRKKRCDENRPICTMCLRLGLRCQYSKDCDKPQPQNLSKISAPVSQTPRDHLTSPRDVARQVVLTCEGSDAGTLFDHFCDKTAPWLINGESITNPILQHIIPLTSQPLVRYTILTIAATHRQTAVPSIPDDSNRYYTSALQELNSALTEWMQCPSDFKPILTSIILLCHCEASPTTPRFIADSIKFIQGDPSDAALKHLLVCHTFMDAAIEQLHDLRKEDFIVFLLEHYGYYLLVSSLRHSLPDHHLHLGLDFSSHILPLIAPKAAFGSIFRFEPESFSLIPRIAKFRNDRRQNIDCHVAYTTILAEIMQSRSLTARHTLEGRDVAIAIKTNTLLLFLHDSFWQDDSASTQESQKFPEHAASLTDSAMAQSLNSTTFNESQHFIKPNSTTSNPDIKSQSSQSLRSNPNPNPKSIPSNPDTKIQSHQSLKSNTKPKPRSSASHSSAQLLSIIQPLVNDTMLLLPHVKEETFCYGLLWSILVTGSFLQVTSQQDLLISKLERHQSSMALYERGVELLHQLWQDCTAFGLSGLEKIANSHGVSVCIC